MPRQTFVIGQRLQLVPAHVLEIVEIDVIGAWARTIGCGALVKGLAGALFAEGLNRLDHQRILGQRREEFGQLRGHPGKMRLGLGQIIVAAGVVEARIAAGIGEKSPARVPSKPTSAMMARIFVMDARDLRAGRWRGFHPRVRSVVV